MGWAERALVVVRRGWVRRGWLGMGWLGTGGLGMGWALQGVEA